MKNGKVAPGGCQWEATYALDDVATTRRGGILLYVYGSAAHRDGTENPSYTDN
jgi:hypothetical protein